MSCNGEEGGLTDDISGKNKMIIRKLTMEEGGEANM